MKTKLKLVATGLIAFATLTPTLAADSPWMVRVRAVHLDWKNGQTGGVLTNNIVAETKTIPEVDVSYFFNKNIAAELVLTYPQKVEVSLGGEKIGSVKALPPSLLLQYHITEFGSTRPYFGAGINYTRFSKRNNLASGAAAVEKSSLGYVVQLGADHMLDKSWGLNVDLKYAQIKTDVTLGGANIGNLDLSPLMIGIGVTYKY